MDLLRKGSRPLFEGREFVIFAQRLVDMNTLSLEIVLDRAGETLIAYVMRRKSRHRAIASGKLMLPLRASLDAGEAARNREFNRLIIADLEMQERMLLDRPPIAPIERVLANKIDGARDIAAIALGHDQ